jgi:hypothetical protein
MKRIGDLEIDQDLEFQKAEWRMERVAWFAGLAILVLGLLGLFGTGPISSATAGDNDGPIAVDYQRFVRHDGEMSLTFTIASNQVKEGQVEVWISEPYLGKVEIEQFSHEPDEVRNEGDRTVFVFLAEDTGEPFSATISMRSQVIGRLSGDIGIVDGSQLNVSQLSYP